MSRNTKIFEQTVAFIREWYGEPEAFLPLHVPTFSGREEELVRDCIQSTFVSSVGKYVDEVEQAFAKYTGAGHAVAVVNGTSALHLALRVAGVKTDDEVITQPFTFVATGNTILYQNAHPVFVDINAHTLGLDPDALNQFLEDNTTQREGQCVNKQTGRIIRACMPMHTYGHPVELARIADICREHHLILIEDAAESIGSFYQGKHTGLIGDIAAFSFNGNKTITCGGGGMVITDKEEWAQRAKHLSTVAKTPHPYEFYHDQMGYNYRMPNLNAALLLAQLEQLPHFLDNKRRTAEAYAQFFADIPEIEFFQEPAQCRSNYWLNVVFLKDIEERNRFLEYTNAQGIMTRPTWRLLIDLPAFKGFEIGPLPVSRSLEKRLVNITSSVKS